MAAILTGAGAADGLHRQQHPHQPDDADDLFFRARDSRNSHGKAKAWSSHEHQQERKESTHSGHGNAHADALTPVLPAAPADAGPEGVGGAGGAGNVAGCGTGAAVKQAVKYTARQQLYLVLEDPDSSFMARMCSHFILYTIVASIACFVLETVPELKDLKVFKIAEPATTVIFTLEYLSRFLACDAFPKGSFGHQSKCDFIKSPMNILDLMAICPFYIELAAAELMNQFKFLRVLRSVRLIRCFRIFKLSKYSLGMTIMVESLLNSVQPLSILIFFLCIGVVLTSSLMFFAERTGCPDVKAMIAGGTFNKYKSECIELDTGRARNGDLCCNEHGAALDFESIARTFWWSIVTMTTVGYGDRVPRTLPGRLVGGMAMLSGIVLISLPVAIVGSKFQLAYESLEEEKRSIQSFDDEEQEQGLDETQNRTEAPNADPQELERVLDLAQAEEEEKRQASDASLLSAEPVAEAKRLRPESEEKPDRHQNQGFGAHGGDEAMSQLEGLRGKLKALDLNPKITEKAAQELYLLLEMFRQVEGVENQLRTHLEKDAMLDAAIRREFASVSRSYDANLREKGVGFTGCDPA